MFEWDRNKAKISVHMGKKTSASSTRALRVGKNVKSIPDSQIDFSDLPELTDEQIGKMKRPGRPLIGSGRRELIALRLDPVVLRKLRSLAKKRGTGYQTLINEVLLNFTKKNAA